VTRTPATRRLGALIRERRLAAGLGQAELGAAIGNGTRQATVSRWEAGWLTPVLDTLLALADLLGFSLDEIREGVAA
jgi:transcriptional regulator with XRE-family HTH domain